MFKYDDLLETQFGEENEKMNDMEEGEYLEEQIDEESLTEYVHKEIPNQPKVSSKKQKKKKRPKNKNKGDIKNNNLKGIMDSNSNSNIQVLSNEECVFVSKVRMINFQTDNECFEKGRNSNITDQDIFSTIPDKKFWINRYYYFSKFDEGIKMDYESKLTFIQYRY